MDVSGTLMIGGLTIDERNGLNGNMNISKIHMDTSFQYNNDEFDYDNNDDVDYFQDDAVMEPQTNNVNKITPIQRQQNQQIDVNKQPDSPTKVPTKKQNVIEQKPMIKFLDPHSVSDDSKPIRKEKCYKTPKILLNDNIESYENAIKE